MITWLPNIMMSGGVLARILMPNIPQHKAANRRFCERAGQRRRTCERVRAARHGTCTTTYPPDPDQQTGPRLWLATMAGGPRLRSQRLYRGLSLAILGQPTAAPWPTSRRPKSAERPSKSHWVRTKKYAVMYLSLPANKMHFGGWRGTCRTYSRPSRKTWARAAGRLWEETPTSRGAGSGTRSRRPEGCRAEIHMDSASQRSGSDENRRNRSFSRWRSLASRSRADPAKRPCRRDAPARDREIGLPRRTLRRVSSKSSLCEAELGQISRRPILRTSGQD